MQATIRRMRREDVEEVEALFQAYMEIRASRRKTILESLKREDSEILVAELEGKVIGLAHQIFYIDPLHAGQCSNILFLCVAEPFRRQGIGKLLLRKTLDSAIGRSVLEVHVSTRAENVAAIGLYKELGFEHAGPLFEYSPNEHTDAISKASSS